MKIKKYDLYYVDGGYLYYISDIFSDRIIYYKINYDTIKDCSVKLQEFKDKLFRKRGIFIKNGKIDSTTLVNLDLQYPQYFL